MCINASRKTDPDSRGVYNITTYFAMLHKLCDPSNNYYCCSVTQSYPTLCDPTDCSTPGFPVLHYLPESLLKLMLTESVMPFKHPIPPLPRSLPTFNFSQHQSFPMSHLFASGGLGIGVSASVLPMNIQGWFPLGLTGLISLLSKALSKVFSSTTVRKHQFIGAQPSLLFNSQILTWLLKKW